MWCRQTWDGSLWGHKVNMSHSGQEAVEAPICHIAYTAMGVKSTLTHATAPPLGPSPLPHLHHKQGVILKVANVLRPCGYDVAVEWLVNIWHHGQLRLSHRPIPGPGGHVHCCIQLVVDGIHSVGVAAVRGVTQGVLGHGIQRCQVLGGVAAVHFACWCSPDEDAGFAVRDLQHVCVSELGNGGQHSVWANGCRQVVTSFGYIAPLHSLRL